MVNFTVFDHMYAWSVCKDFTLNINNNNSYNNNTLHSNRNNNKNLLPSCKISSNRDIWNNNNMSFNNCYSYAMRDINNIYKPNPGMYSDRDENERHLTSCEDIYSYIKSDYPNRKIYIPHEEDNTQQCKKCNFYKVALYVDNEDEKDFHFYRQNHDGYWSHKPGSGPVTNVDAEGNLITDPDKADRNYGDLNYTKVCKKMCVPYVYNRELDFMV